MRPSLTEALGHGALLLLGATLAFSQRSRVREWRAVALWSGSGVLVLLALASSVEVDVRWIAALALVGAVVALLAGRRLRPHLGRPLFIDAAVLLALAVAALLAAPELLRGWDRAGVAVEGASTPPPQADAPWAVLVVTVAFAITLLWGARRYALTSPRRNQP